MWAGPLESGSRRRILLVQNYGSKDVDVQITFLDVPGLSIGDKPPIRDVWAKKSVRHDGKHLSLIDINPA